MAERTGLDDHATARGKRRLSAVLLALLALWASACGTSDGSTGSARHTFFQVSTLGALSIGLYEGALSVGEMLEHGDFGLGTFDALDGEMVVLDGQVFRVGTDGLPRIVADGETTPFAAVTDFSADQILTFDGPLDYAELQQKIDDELTTLNVPVAIKIAGNHPSLLVRSVPKQSEPYPPLADAVAMQTEFDLTDVEGTLVGFRTPAYLSELNAAGYHFHFLSDDHLAGGHVLDGLVDATEVQLQYMRDFRMALPDNAAFDDAVLPAGS
jgi:acetolactate decarboxylase